MLKHETQSEAYVYPSAQLKSQSQVTCRFFQTDDVSSVIAVLPQVSLNSTSVTSGKVEYSGKLIVTVVYCDSQGKLCRMQKGAEFNHFAEDSTCAPANTALCALTCQNSTVRRDGSSLVVTAIIQADVTVFCRTERTFLTSVSGAYAKIQPVTTYSAVTFSGEAEVEDDFQADSVEDVLTSNAQVLITQATCSTGEVLISGEMYLSLFAMRANAPVCMDRTIPFKCAIPCDDSSSGKTALVNCNLTDISVTASVDENKGKCHVDLTASLSFNGVFYDEKQMEATTDIFSQTNGLDVTFSRHAVSPCTDLKVYNERVSGLCALSGGVDYTCRFLAVAMPKAECFINVNAVDGECLAEGEVSAQLIYEQGEEVKSCAVSLPFSLPLNGIESGNVEVCVAVCGMGAKQRAEGEVEAEATLKISAFIKEEKVATVVSAVEEGEVIAQNKSAITVYMAKRGDDVWQIAKNLKCAPKLVEECNPSLTYPLCGSERVIIYRSKNC